MIERYLNLSRILGDQNSALLFGPRGTGKTHLIKHFLATRSSALTIDLLDPREHNRYFLNPAQLIRDVEGAMVEQRDMPLLVCIDEVQKIPQLLDEVHLLLARFRGRVQFLLTGSSARKLKRVGVNLLAGRAWTLRLHPFTTLEERRDP